MEPTGTSRSCPSDQLVIAPQRIPPNIAAHNRAFSASAQRPVRAGRGSMNGRVTHRWRGPVRQSTKARMPFLKHNCLRGRGEITRTVRRSACGTSPSFESSLVPGRVRRPVGGGILMSTRRRRLEGAAYRVRGRTDGRSSRRAHDDLPSGVALFQVRDCCRNFGERIAPVDVGAHFAALNQVRKELQIRSGYVR
jgi:hypothetical protein